jgi:hypothetical protein
LIDDHAGDVIEPYKVGPVALLAGNWKTTLDKRAAKICYCSSVPQPRLLGAFQTFGC